MTRKIQALAASVAALSLVSAAPAAASAVTSPAIGAHQVSPFVALSLFGSAQAQAALCATTAASAAAAAGAAAAQTMGAQPGCVLPVVDAPPPAVMTQMPPPVMVAPLAPAVPAASGSIFPLLLGLAGVAAVIAYIVTRDDKGGSVNFPVPPASPA